MLPSIQSGMRGNHLQVDGPWPILGPTYCLSAKFNNKVTALFPAYDGSGVSLRQRKFSRKQRPSKQKGGTKPPL